ncbi:MAG: hypothetical protein LBJ67_09030 [Planctomycetaceae bacterium]|jgi:hypothetical protein|nr:hypothetical protein [Planctomycetaceae bacterium]
MTKHISLYFLVVLFSYSINIAIAETPVTILEKVRKILEQNVEQLDPISLVWVSQRSTNLELEPFFKKIKSEHHCGFLEPVNCVFMWEEGCGYLCRLSKTLAESSGDTLPLAYAKDLKLSTHIDEKSVDGKNFYSGGKAQKDKIGGLGVNPINQASLYQIFTINMGYKYPTFGDEFQTPPMSYILYLAQNGEVLQANQDSLDGEEVFKIKIRSECRLMDQKTSVSRLITFWCLPKYNYAIKRINVESLDGKMLYCTKNENFQLIPGKTVYLPYHITIDYYTFVTAFGDISSSPLFTEDFFLKEISTNPVNKKQFDLRNKYNDPGTLVTDRTLRDTDDGVSYYVPANPADLDRVIESALTGKDFTPTPLPSRAAIIIRWIIILIGLGMILYAGYRKFIQKI